MADTRDIEIEIYGKIRSLEAIKELAVEMDGHVAPDFGESYLEEYDAFGYIVECLEKRSPIRVVRDDTSDGLDGIASVCQEHGLAYCKRIHKTEWISPGMETWAPGWDEPQCPAVDENHDISIKLDELKKIKRKGADALNAHIAELERISLEDFPKKATAPADVLEAARNYEGDDEEPVAPGPAR